MITFDSSFRLREAIDFHQRGDLAAACRCYAEILRREPHNVDVNYLLGLANCHLGNVPEAVKRLRKAVALAPSHAPAHYTLSMALRELGKLDESLANCDRAIASDQSFAEAHAHRGDILQDLHRPQDALRAYDRALELLPNLVPAWINRGSILQKFERHQEALASYDRATALDPNIAEAWLNRAKSQRALGLWQDAIASCDRAIALRPDFAPSYLARGILLRDCAQFDDAIACIDRAISLQPGWLEARLERASTLQRQGNRHAALTACQQITAAHPAWLPGWQLQSELLYDAGRLDDAFASVEREIALQPDFADAHALRGAILIKQNRPAEAVDALDRAIAIAPERATFHVDRGLALIALARFEEAAAAMERGCRIDTGNPHIQFVAGLVDLLHGRWLEGFARYEHRLEVPQFNLVHRRLLLSGRDIDQRFSQVPAPPMREYPRWGGGEPTGELILLETEQGLGDAIQFAGFAAHLARLGHRIQILTLPVLAPLLRTVPGIDAVISDQQALDSLDVKSWLPLMSVPHLLDVTPNALPVQIPFLSAEPDRVADWGRRLGGDKFKVGIAWQGNAQNWLDAGRSIPLQAFAPIAGIPGVRLISLQKSPGAEHIDAVGFCAQIERPMDAADKSADALLDTAALLSNLDLVVTSDSMLAHLAGALGRPTFVALRRIPDWRWLLDREDSPWYPTARLFRQQTEGDWTPVFEQIAQAIRALIATVR
jgi:tetratricopeptide (TPR) repeat protein